MQKKNFKQALTVCLKWPDSKEIVVWRWLWNFSMKLIKFIYSEKATKFFQNLHLNFVQALILAKSCHQDYVQFRFSPLFIHLIFFSRLAKMMPKLKVSLMIFDQWTWVFRLSHWPKLRVFIISTIRPNLVLPIKPAQKIGNPQSNLFQSKLQQQLQSH